MYSGKGYLYMNTCLRICIGGSCRKEKWLVKTSQKQALSQLSMNPGPNITSYQVCMEDGGGKKGKIGMCVEDN